MKTLQHSIGVLLSLFAVALFTTPGYSQDAPDLTDPEIASVAVTANQIDVDYAAIAWKKEASDEVMNFAKTMRDDHNAVIKMATQLAQKLNVTPKDNPMTQSLLDQAKKTKESLNSKAGKDFEKAYIDNEVAYHKSVIDAVKNVLIPQTENKELKDLFEKIMPTLETHLKHAKKIQKDYQ